VSVTPSRHYRHFTRASWGEQPDKCVAAVRTLMWPTTLHPPQPRRAVDRGYRAGSSRLAWIVVTCLDRWRPGWGTSRSYLPMPYRIATSGVITLSHSKGLGPKGAGTDNGGSRTGHQFGGVHKKIWQTDVHEDIRLVFVAGLYIDHVCRWSQLGRNGRSCAPLSRHYPSQSNRTTRRVLCGPPQYLFVWAYYYDPA
jgi:hypothetical protein